MFKFLDYFKHQDIYKSRSEIKKQVLLPVATTVLLFILVAPLGVVTPIIIFLVGVLVFNYFNLYIPPFFCYLIGIVLSYILRLGFSGYSNYSEVVASTFMLITMARSLCLGFYRDTQMVLMLLICANASTLLLDSSATLILFTAANSFYILSQILRMHIKDYSLSILLSSMRGALRVVLYSLPLMFLFVWLFKQSNSVHKKYQMENATGVSTDMQPGEYSKLSNNHGIVFRVALNRKFPDDLEIPYWRVATLSKGVGLHWTEEKTKKNYSRIVLEDSKCLFKQTFYRQDLDLKVLSAALDYSIHTNSSNERVYTALSDICSERRVEKPQTVIPNPKLASSSKIQLLLGVLKKNGDKPEVVVDNLMAFFRKNKFKVTMEPATLPGGKEFETFLFNTKEGYCEHFAGATATLLQLMKIPARVVVGYAGGRYNNLANYWQISYADSHAWVEYWNGQKWQRVDPTAIVGYQLSMSKKYDDFYEWLMSFTVIKYLWFAMDSLSFRVQRTFINAEKIISFQDLSYDPWLVLASLLLLFVGIQIKKYQKPTEEKIISEFNNLCRVISDKGMPRGRIEGYDAYRKKVVETLDKKNSSDLKSKIDNLFSEYLVFRYGNQVFNKKEKDEFLTQIKETSQLFKKKVKVKELLK